MSEPDQWFTVVFPGAAESYQGNPYLADTPFGRAQRIARGDVLAQCDGLLDDAEELREILHDLVMDECEKRAIGGGPGWKERHEKSWARAMELFEP